MLNIARVPLVMDVQCHACQGVGDGLDRIHPDGSDHAYTWVRLVVSEFKREVPRLNVNPRRGDEHRLEPDAFGTDISVGG